MGLARWLRPSASFVRNAYAYTCPPRCGRCCSQAACGVDSAGAVPSGLFLRRSAPHLPWMKAAAMPKLASMPALHAKLPPPRPLVWHRYIDNHWRPQQATKVRNALPRHRANRISVCTSPRAEGPYVEHLVRSEVSAGAHRLSPADDREGEPGYPVPSRSYAEGATDYMRAPVGSQALLRIGSSATSRSSVELRRAE